MTSIRVGIGFDFHPFEKGRPLVLGGVSIPGETGLRGHSDADVLLHAVADAVLGAAAMKDIGTFFPDTDQRYRDLSSLILLEKVGRLVRGKGFQIVNVDTVVVAEWPRIAPHVEAIQANIGRVLLLAPERVGVKATTMESCGAVGRREGIAAQAVALLEKTS